MPLSVDEIAGALYAGDPAAFVAARDAAVKELRAEKRRSEAGAVKALARPTVAAAGVNRVVRSGAVEALWAAGDALAAAQEALLAGEADAAALRKAKAAHEDVLSGVVAEAGEGARETLRAASIDGAVREVVAGGRLAKELAPGAAGGGFGGGLEDAFAPAPAKPKAGAKPEAGVGPKAAAGTKAAAEPMRRARSTKQSHGDTNADREAEAAAQPEADAAAKAEAEAAAKAAAAKAEAEAAAKAEAAKAEAEAKAAAAERAKARKALGRKLDKARARAANSAADLASARERLARVEQAAATDAERVTALEAELDEVQDAPDGGGLRARDPAPGEVGPRAAHITGGVSP